MEIEKIDFTKLVPRRIGPRKRLNDEELLHLLNKSTKSSGVGDVDKEIEKSQQKKIEGLKNARSVMKDRKIPENIQKIIQKSKSTEGLLKDLIEVAKNDKTPAFLMAAHSLLNELRKTADGTRLVEKIVTEHVLTANRMPDQKGVDV